MTDKELIRKVHNGNKDALGIIINRYYDEIYRFCLFLTGAEIDSYDITQEVFLKFIRYVDTYQYKNLKGYLLTIARNCCHDHFRHKKDMVAFEDIEIAG
ncbi:MAG: helix-turn-helix domain-containing protein, partial [Lachnospiraceae bacterium]|nr:helix-turn-helix domain-containing protein [Lachnospiraceae bacterium]